MLRRLAALTLTALAVLAVLSEPAVAAVSSTLSLDQDAPDPFVLKASGSYYAYSTETYFTNVPVVRSTSLTGPWERLPDALPKLPAWAQSGRTWAPAVAKLGSGYVLYFTAWHKSSGRECIGVATSSAPAGPFTPTSSKPLVCQLEYGGSIDPSVFVTSTGVPYLLWKSEDNALNRESRLWSQKLSSAGTSFASYTSPAILAKHNSGTWEGYTIEGPTMVQSNGTFHLFYGAGFWSDSTASIGWATCTSPTGGCVKKGQWLSSTDDPKGPSGPEVFSDGTTLRFVHHGWRPDTGYVQGTSNRRAMYVGTLTFSNGVPVLGAA